MSDYESTLRPDLTGRAALVTGASRGIGRRIAIELARCGAHTFLVARTAEALDSVCEEIRKTGGRAAPFQADAADPRQVKAVFERIDAAHDGSLDILINNAGTGRFALVKDTTIEDWDALMEINLRGTFLFCREAVKRMIPGKKGTIINIASVVGLKGYVNQGAYTASKHGIVGLTKTLAAELQEHGIKVSVICPGGVDTDLVAQARPDLDRSILMKPEDIAQTVLYLLALPPRTTVDMIYIRRYGSAPF